MKWLGNTDWNGLKEGRHLGLIDYMRYANGFPILIDKGEESIDIRCCFPLDMGQPAKYVDEDLTGRLIVFKPQLIGLSSPSSASLLFCFRARINFEFLSDGAKSIEDEFKTQLFDEFLEHLTGQSEAEMKKKDTKFIQVLVFVDWAHSQSIMIVDDGRYDKLTSEDDISS